MPREILVIVNGERRSTTTDDDRPLLDVLREDRGETFDPWLVDLFEEEIRKSPLPKKDAEPVMISPGGIAPYKAAARVSMDDPEQDTLLYWIEALDEELEVLGDDPGGDGA